MVDIKSIEVEGFGWVTLPLPVAQLIESLRTQLSSALAERDAEKARADIADSMLSKGAWGYSQIASDAVKNSLRIDNARIAAEAERDSLAAQLAEARRVLTVAHEAITGTREYALLGPEERQAAAAVELFLASDPTPLTLLHEKALTFAKTEIAWVDCKSGAGGHFTARAEAEAEFRDALEAVEKWRSHERP